MRHNNRTPSGRPAVVFEGVGLSYENGKKARRFCGLLLPHVQPAEKLVGDGAGFLGHLLGPQAAGAVCTQEGHHVPWPGLRDMGHVDDELVHAEIADDMGAAAPDQGGQFPARQAPGQAVGVADGDRGGAHRGVRPEAPPVAHRFAGLQITDRGDAGAERKDGPKRHAP